MQNFPFKESEFDFDDLLIEKGFKLIFDREDYLIYSKDLSINTDSSKEHESKFNYCNPLRLEISHPKILNSVAKYYLYGPYEIMAVYFTNPNYMYRQMTWKMFPGSKRELLSEMIDVAEKEAINMYSACIKTDLHNINIEEMNERIKKIKHWDIDEN